MNYCKIIMNIAKRWSGKPEVCEKNKYLFLLAICIVFFTFNTLANSQDQQILRNSGSPYLAMHATDKVRWQLWQEQIFRDAKKQNKPIYLTIGYFSCYWCHVLQQQSFLNEELATYVNENFIAVVIDRELFPVLDSRLSHFAEQTIGRSGWPLNVILTPDGYPFMATIYQPPKQFLAWFKKVIGLWQTDPQYIREISAQATEELNFGFKAKKTPITRDETNKITHAFIAEVMSAFDEFEGGFGDQAKFPLPSILMAILELYQQTKKEQLAEVLKLSLEKMASLGLWDHLQAGFFRYTTDPGWQIPHFEKMLYDNAQLASLYLRAGNVFANEKFTEVGKQILDFILANMQSEQGAYYSSFSAVDEKGVEGGYYLWAKNDWQKILDDSQQKIVRHAWDWGANSAIAEGFLPVPAMALQGLATKLNQSEAEVNVAISGIKMKLLAERKKRWLPRDEKIILSWNALLLNALIDAYHEFGDKKYFDLAQKLTQFMQSVMYNKGKLNRSWHKAILAGDADLEDYVYSADALYRWYLLTNDAKTLSSVKTFATYAWENYFNEQGWKMSNKLLIPYGAAEALLADGPLPSASAKLILLSLNPELNDLQAKAGLASQFGHGILAQQAFWFASHVVVLNKLSPAS